MSTIRPSTFFQDTDIQRIKQAAASSSVMIVDNDATTMLLMGELLKGLGFRIIESRNGHEALYLIDRQHPLLIFMDVDMPHMDGYETTRLIRQMPEPISDTPVIALIAGAGKNDRDKCLKAGMNDYISKPFRLDELIKKLRIFFAV